MVLLKLLDSYDRATDPLNNGIASKELLYDMTNSLYSKSSDFKKLNLLEQDDFIKEHLGEYIDCYVLVLKKKFNLKNIQVEEAIKGLNKEDKEEAIKVMNYLSSLHKLLNDRFSDFNNWIVASKDFKTIESEYNKQDIHRVAIIDTETNGIFDKDNRIGIDISNPDTIAAVKYISNPKNLNSELLQIMSILTECNKKIADYFIKKLALAAKEDTINITSNSVAFYDYIPSNRVLSVFGALQMDLLCNKLLNIDYLKLSKEAQEREIKLLKQQLLYLVKEEKNPFLLYVYEQLYLEDKNIDSILDKHITKETLLHKKDEVLKLARSVPNMQICR